MATDSDYPTTTPPAPNTARTERTDPLTIRVGILTAPRIDYTLLPHSFVLRNVRIGIGFHWDRYEEQEFEGALELLHNPDGSVTAVNTLPIEDYLTAVIASEMSADSPLELLKAHAVISRSWALHAIINPAAATGHRGYDVCADDHCQRYEGIRYRDRNPRAVQAVRETEGLVLTYEGALCDTRYHKCCGGMTERFSTCWEDRDYPYLRPVACPYCARAVGQTALLQRVLNAYDRETPDFYTWERTYTQEELQEIIAAKFPTLPSSAIRDLSLTAPNGRVSGENPFGKILALRPLQTGASGRIYALGIMGTRACATVGKELAIRQLLSPSCLYSSAFEVTPLYATSRDDRTDPLIALPDASRFRIPDAFRLRGRGWGHGVGLCQIGAAVMATQAFDYREILSHYYPGSSLSSIQQVLA